MDNNRHFLVNVCRRLVCVVCCVKVPIVLHIGVGWDRGPWGTLIFLYIRRLGSFSWVQNFEFQYFLGFSEK